MIAGLTSNLLVDKLMFRFTPEMELLKHITWNIGINYTKKYVNIHNFELLQRCCSKKCRIGYFYGFKTKGRKLYYDDNCLEKPFFFSSRKTG